MFKSKILNSKVVLRRYFIYLTSLVVVIIPALLLKMIVDSYFPEFRNQTEYIILIIAITIFPTLKRYFYKVANKYFFSSLYDDRKFMVRLSDKLGSTLESHQIYEYISKELKKSFHTKSLIFLIFNGELNEYEIKYRKGVDRLKPKTFLGTESLNRKLAFHNKPIVISEMSKIEYEENKAVYDLMKKWGAKIIIPFNFKKTVVGLLLLSEKVSEDTYDEVDLRVLEFIGSHGAMAIKNAQLYHETIGFNARLINEVEKATFKLREANEQLKKLDQAKSEFVSITSHQLRTPLTVVKGYVSMMLDGSFGKITEKQKESLEKVYSSNERLINLVENFLNISRIESGRLVLSYENTQVEDLVVSVFEELYESAKKKKINFEHTEPKSKLPIIRIDKEKVRQVLMNLADNSIKYTKEGGNVKIVISSSEDKVSVCLEDSGMGISSSDLPKLFTKFGRGEDISLVHTEGTGLGLYVAKQIIEAHGGRIWAESAGIGRGSRFCFVLPTERKGIINLD